LADLELRVAAVTASLQWHDWSLPDVLMSASYPGPAATLLSAVAAGPALSPHGEEALAPSRTMRPHSGLHPSKRPLTRPAQDEEKQWNNAVGFLFVLIVGLIAGTISGIVGTGSSIMLMPVLVYQY